MTPYTLTQQQARQFVLRWQGLLGPKRFSGTAGVLQFVRQAGCLQYDPVDLCGKNAEIALFARVAGFKKPVLDKLLYKQRALVDHWDKNMSLYPAEDWPCFARNRRAFRGWSYNEESRQAVLAAAGPVLQAVRQQGVVCSQQLNLPQKIDWPWAPTALARAVLEYLYFTGELCIHHRRGTQRYYTAAESCLPTQLLAADDPNPGADDYYAWHTLRRIAAAGLLWNRASDAFLAIPGYGTGPRQAAFEQLAAEGRVLPCRVEGINQTLYCPQAGEALLQDVLGGAKAAPRLELISPLDSLLWDRRLLAALFGFEYKWEIYTPAAKRRYGAYTLPVLYGTRFAGRTELRCQRPEGTLVAEHFWPEADFRPTISFCRRFGKQLERFARFNGCEQVIFGPGFEAVSSRLSG